MLLIVILYIIAHLSTITQYYYNKLRFAGLKYLKLNIHSIGLCPGLFTTSELLVISNKLQKGKVKKTMQSAKQIFAKAVLRNLHVFVVWDVNCETGSIFSFEQDYSHDTQSGGREKSVHQSEESLRTIFSSLCQACSYIDHYQGWSKQAYTDIALQWWQHEHRYEGRNTKLDTYWFVLTFRVHFVFYTYVES